MQVMETIAKGLDILQGDKYVHMGYLLPTILSITDHLKTKVSSAVYTKPLIDVLLANLQKR